MFDVAGTWAELFLSTKQGGGSSEKPLDTSSSGRRQFPNQSGCRDKSSSTSHGHQCGEGRQNPIQAAVCNRADWMDILLLSCRGRAGKLHCWWRLCNVFSHLLQSCLASARRRESGHPAAAAPGARQPQRCQAGWPSAARCPETNEKSKNNASSCCLSATRQKSKPRTVCSESPWQRISCCYATQETREGESCDPVMVISLAQIKLRFKIKKN